MNRKTLVSTALLLVVLLSVVPATLFLAPLVPVVTAATGQPRLAAVQCNLGGPTCTSIQIAEFNVSLKLGDYYVSKVDGTTVTNKYFAIVFAIGNTTLVTFSGAVFDLYLSKDGYSVLSPGDIKLVEGFRVADLYALPKNVTKVVDGVKYNYTIGRFTIDTTTYSLLIGPIPKLEAITAEYKYIKVFDGVTTAVAVARETVELLPTVWLEPEEGPGGATVTLYGTVLKPNELVNITYTIEGKDIVRQVYTDALGKFKYTWRIEDLKKDWTGRGTIPSDPITIDVKYNKTELGTIGTVTFTEYRRAFVELRSLEYKDEELKFVDLKTGAGNDTLTVDVYVFDKVVVAGAWWNPTDTARIYVGDKLLATATPNATHGFFNVTIEVPELPSGEHVVKVVNAGVVYVFKINVHPTLLLIPKEGYVGDTVEVRAYGFDPNEFFSVWWEGCADWTNVVNATTGPDGKFNVTARFKVPVDYGGDHSVGACAGYEGRVCDDFVAEATFKIKPKLTVTPSVFPNDGRVVTVSATGLEVDSSPYYKVVFDSSFFGILECHECGNFTLSVVAAGFRPGLHWVGVYRVSVDSVATLADQYGKFEPVVSATFNVTGMGDPVYELLNSTSVAVVTIQGNVAKVVTVLGTVTASLDTIKSLIERGNAVLTEVRDGVATIKTDVGTIKVRVEELKPVVTAIQGDVATVKTDLGTIKADVSAVKSLVAEVKTGVSDVKAGVSDVKNTVADVKGTVAGVKDAAAALPTISVAVWIAVVFSLIAAVLSALTMFSVRKKIAG